MLFLTKTLETGKDLYVEGLCRFSKVFISIRKVELFRLYHSNCFFFFVDCLFCSMVWNSSTLFLAFLGFICFLTFFLFMPYSQYTLCLFIVCFCFLDLYSSSLFLALWRRIYWQSEILVFPILNPVYFISLLALPFVASSSYSIIHHFVDEFLFSFFQLCYLDLLTLHSLTFSLLFYTFLLPVARCFLIPLSIVLLKDWLHFLAIFSLCNSSDGGRRKDIAFFF